MAVRLHSDIGDLVARIHAVRVLHLPHQCRATAKARSEGDLVAFHQKRVRQVPVARQPEVFRFLVRQEDAAPGKDAEPRHREDDVE